MDTGNQVRYFSRQYFKQFHEQRRKIKIAYYDHIRQNNITIETDEQVVAHLIDIHPNFAENVMLFEVVNGAGVLLHVVDEKDPIKRLNKMRFLIDIGVSPNEPDQTGHLALNALLRTTHVIVDDLKLLIQGGANINKADIQSYPLHAAILCGADIIQYLLSHGANVFQKTNEGTFLHRLASVQDNIGITVVCNYVREKILHEAAIVIRFWWRCNNMPPYIFQYLTTLTASYLGNLLCLIPN